MIKMIVATSKNNQIGINGDMPWHISEDLKYFKETTKGFSVLMGRKTFESIGRPLPHRTNIVLTKDTSFFKEGVQLVHSFKEALELCKEQDVFIIGGGEIYTLFLPYTEELYITLIDKEVEGDTAFPEYKDEFEMVSSTPGKSTTEDGCTFAFTIWKRK